MSWSASVEVPGPVTPYLEGFWFSRQDPDGGRVAALDTGAIYVINPRLALDGGHGGCAAQGLCRHRKRYRPSGQWSRPMVRRRTIRLDPFDVAERGGPEFGALCGKVTNPYRTAVGRTPKPPAALASRCKS